MALALSGSVRRAGTQLRITAQLVDVSNGYTLWSEQFDRPMDDVFAVQDEMTLAIVSILRQRWLSSAPRPSAPYRPSVEAYHLYLKGLFHQRKLAPPSLAKSIEYFQLAVAKDPKYALAYAQMAMSYVVMGIYFVRPADVMPQAKAAALKALEFDETSVDAHGVLGLVKLLYEWEWAEAERELKLGGRINRCAIDALACTCHLMESLGKCDDAIEAIQHGLDADPLSVSLIAEMGCTSYYGRRYDDAIARSFEAIDMAPEAHLAYWVASRAYGQKQMYAEAITTLNKALQISPMCPPFIFSELGYVHGRAGNRTEAEKFIEQLKQLAEKFYVDSFFIGVIYLGLDDVERAIDHFEDALSKRSGLILSLKGDPKFTEHLTHPRMSALLSQARLA